jgi:hypothetical protein
MVKKLLSVVLIVLVLAPSAALALDTTIPEFNPLCWRQKDCEEARRRLSPDNRETTGGWIQESPCTGTWGKCLPSGTTETSIAFGGRRSFLHLGDFIQHMYRYAIAIAGIVAVIVLMTAGYEWITAGGNSERISSAKKRIGGALMGLFLAFMSYFILNVISPNLVQFRLPQVWMVRPQQLVPAFCGAAPSTTVFSLAAGTEDQTGTPSSTNPDFDAHGFTYSGQPDPTDSNKINTDWKSDTFFCGKRFFMKDAGVNTCYGDVCLPDQSGNAQLCTDLPYNGKPVTKRYYCRPGFVAGSISGNAGGATGQVVEGQWDGGNVQLLALCNNGKIEEAAWVNSESTLSPHSFVITSRNLVEGIALKDHCLNDREGIAGFYLGVNANDQAGCFARLTGFEGTGGSCGASDWFAIGESSPGSHQCDFNLARAMREKFIGLNNTNVVVTPGECGYGNLECTCGFFSNAHVAFTAAKNPELRSHLIPLSALEKGYTCNVVINRSEFPAADNMVDPPNVTGSLVNTSVAGINMAQGAAVGGGIAIAGCALAGVTIGVFTMGLGFLAVSGACMTAWGPYLVGGGAAAFGTADFAAKNWGKFTDPTACNKQESTVPPNPDPYIDALKKAG